MPPPFSPQTNPQRPQLLNNPLPNERDTTMNTAVFELLALLKGVASLAIHDSHKVNILNAVLAGVEAAATDYQTAQAAPVAAK